MSATIEIEGHAVVVCGRFSAVVLQPYSTDDAPTSHLSIIPLYREHLQDKQEWAHAASRDFSTFPYKLISVTDTHFRCWRPHRNVSAYKEGFEQELEAGMSSGLLAALGQVQRAQIVAAEASSAIHGAMKRALTSLEHNLILRVAAACVYWGKSPANVMASLVDNQGERRCSPGALARDKLEAVDSALRSGVAHSLLSRAGQETPADWIAAVVPHRFVDGGIY